MGLAVLTTAVAFALAPSFGRARVEPAVVSNAPVKPELGS